MEGGLVYPVFMVHLVSPTALTTSRALNSRNLRTSAALLPFPEAQPFALVGELHSNQRRMKDRQSVYLPIAPVLFPFKTWAKVPQVQSTTVVGGPLPFTTHKNFLAPVIGRRTTVPFECQAAASRADPNV